MMRDAILPADQQELGCICWSSDHCAYTGFCTHPHRGTFTTPSPDIHRVKRAALNPFFSRKKVLDLEEIVQQKARRLVSRMESAFGTTGSIDLHHGFRAISVDVISDYAFGYSYDFLNQEDFGVEFFNMIRDFGPAFWFFQQFPAIQPVALKTPFWVAKLTSPPLTRMILHQEVCIVYLLSCSGLTSAELPSTNPPGQGFCELGRENRQDDYLPSAPAARCGRGLCRPHGGRAEGRSVYSSGSRG